MLEIHYLLPEWLRGMVPLRLFPLEVGDNCHEIFGTGLNDRSRPQLFQDKVGT